MAIRIYPNNTTHTQLFSVNPAMIDYSQCTLLALQYITTTLIIPNYLPSEINGQKVSEYILLLKKHYLNIVQLQEMMIGKSSTTFS